MSDLLEFPDAADFKKVSYIDDNGDMGVSTKCKSLGVYRLNKDDFEFVYNGGSILLDRATLAEFLQVSKVFIDPDDKYLPHLDMIGCDY
jgi:hypothetical protein